MTKEEINELFDKPKVDVSKIKEYIKLLGGFENKIKEVNVDTLNRHLPLLIVSVSELFEGQECNPEFHYTLGIGDGELHTLKVLYRKGVGVGVDPLLDQKLDLDSLTFTPSIIKELEFTIDKTKNRIIKYL